LTKTSGTGAFGGTTTITNIISATVISITSTTANTAGAIVFDIGGATDVTASGGGITLKGTTDKTFNWVSSTGAWTSSEDLNLASGKVYEINGTSVLSATGLGSSVTSSSLTSVGTITSGTWSGSFGAVSGANLTSLTAGNLSGTIPSAVLANSSVNIGTTSVALNRASANLALTGISSVTLPGSTSGSVQIIPVAAAGTTVLTLPATTGTVVTTGDTGTVSSAMIVNGTIVDGDISTSAAIAGTKISPNFGSQTIQTTGTASFGRTKFNRQDTATEGGEIVLGRAHNNDDAWIIDAANDLYAPDLRFYDVYSGLTRLLIKSTNGNVGIGKTNPSTALDVNGTVTATTFVGNLIGTASAIADGAVTQASTSNMLVPAGAVMAFAMNSAPTGWLVCDGRAVDRSGPSGYPTLFAAIGTTYGVGNNSTTFNLPNLQGIFVRGSGSQTVNGVSYSRTHATTQNDALQNISGTVGQFDAAFAPTVATGAFTTTQVTRTTGGGGSGKYLTADFDASRVARADVETRPVNIAMLYCIKI
jgi:microcystin-dependent protein